MTYKNTATESFFTASQLCLTDVLEYVDALHTAASEGESTNFTGMNEAEMIDHLREIIYTAQEALIEIDAQRTVRFGQSAQRTVLRIVPKIDKAG